MPKSYSSGPRGQPYRSQSGERLLFSFIQERRGRLIGAVGSCLIDVTGKDELALYFRLCNRLGIDGRFIADLDALFGGSLRQVAAKDERCKEYLQKTGVGSDGMEVIGRLEKPLGDCVQAVEQFVEAGTQSPVMDQLKQSFRVAANEEPEKVKARRRYAMTVALLNYFEDVATALPAVRDKLEVVRGLVLQVIEGFKRAQVYLLPKGELENYMPSYSGNPFSVSNGDKASVFEQERTYLLDNAQDGAGLDTRYGDLVHVLDAVTRVDQVSVDKQVAYHLSDWVHKVQCSFRRNAPPDLQAVKDDPLVDWKTYSRLLDVLDYCASGGGFTCRIKLKNGIDPHERELTFTDGDVPAQITLPTHGSISR